MTAGDQSVEEIKRRQELALAAFTQKQAAEKSADEAAMRADRERRKREWQALSPRARLRKCMQKIGAAVLGLLMMAAFATALGVFMIVSAWLSGGISGLSPLWYWGGIFAGSVLWWGGIAVWVLFQRLAERRKLRQEAEMTEQEREERGRMAIAELGSLIEE